MLLLAGGFGSFSQPQPPSPPQEQPAETRSEDAGHGQRTEKDDYSDNLSEQAYRFMSRLIDWMDRHNGFITGVFTFFIALFTFGLIVIVNRQVKIARDAERACIGISHKTPPGFKITTPMIDGTNKAQIAVKFKNFGKTPGRVVEVFFTTKCVPHGQMLDGRVDYGTTTPIIINAFLVPRGNVIFKQPDFEFIADMPKVQASELDLWFIGYADFVDVFGAWHRMGYARLYDPEIPLGSNNLVFGRERGYNNEWPIRKRND